MKTAWFLPLGIIAEKGPSFDAIFYLIGGVDI